MSMFSLRTIIDDILLIVRNNNISESEDLSRAQIAAWVLHYRAAILRQKRDEAEEKGDEDDFLDDSCTKTIGPIEIEDEPSLDNYPLFTRKTKETINDLLDGDPDNIISVYDQQGCVIQNMHGLRRHYHYFRKYTGRELTYDYDSKYILIQGNMDCGMLRHIWVKYIADISDEEAEDEDEVKIPGWMIPRIKELILKNELSFMIKMPSDDDNNSTLDGIKPHGAQDQEK